jgi:hypothetical protein
VNLQNIVVCNHIFLNASNLICKNIVSFPFA